MFLKCLCWLTIIPAGMVFAEKLELTCDTRDLLIDTELGLLEIEAPNNTLLTPDKTFRGIEYREADLLIRFRLLTDYYTEGWALDPKSLMAYSVLTFLDNEGVDPIRKRYNCVETPPGDEPEKLPRQKVGKRPRKRGF